MVHKRRMIISDQSSFEEGVVQDPNEMMDRSHRLSLLLHRALAKELDESDWRQWAPRAQANLVRLRSSVRGQIHHSSLDRWEHLISAGDLASVKTVLCGADAESIRMREVSPFAGMLSQDQRTEIVKLFFAADRNLPPLLSGPPESWDDRLP